MNRVTETTNLNQDPEMLVARYVENPRADLKDLIIVQYAGLVERVARKFRGIEPHDDLVSVGFIGLLNALSKFDPSNGVRFNTYATYLVAGEIKHYLRDRAQTIRQPAWVQELRHKVTRAQVALQVTLGRTPTHREIAEQLGVTEASVQEVLSSADLLKVGSLDASQPGEDEGDSEVERLDAADFCPEQIGMEDRLLLEGAMRQLRDLERQVLMHFHFDAMNQTEIAAKLGISCNYVSHILRQSLGKLRKILNAEEQKDRLLRRQTAAIAFDVTDETTGAYTEAYFRNRLSEELHRASASEDSVAVLLIRFSGLEGMRRFYGEQSVNDFMVDAAEFLKGSVRRLDIVARFGESGFAVLLPFTGSSVSVVRQRLADEAEKWGHGRVGAMGGLVVEIGTAFSPQAGRTASDLLAAAMPVAIDTADVTLAA